MSPDHGRLITREFPPMPSSSWVNITPSARILSLEEHKGFGQGAFAIAPRDLFHNHGGATAAVDAPHGVQQKDEEPPEGNKLKNAFR